MRRLTLLLALAALSLLAAVPAVAETAAQTQPLQIDDVSTDDTQVTVTVTAPRDLIGTELTDEAFAVTEAGESRSSDVTAVPGDDLQIVLAIDTSGSMAGSMDAAREAATRFVERLPSGVEAAVMGFGWEPAVASSFTSDTAALTTAINGLEASGETALYDAVRAAVELFPDASNTRQTVVLLSDGGDTVSSADLDAATGLLADSDVTLHALELRSDESDPEALNQLVGVTDGRMVSANDAAALADVYDDVLSVLVNQYRITFTAEGQGPTSIEVALDAGDVQRSAATSVALPVPPLPAPQPGTQIAAPPAPVPAVPDSAPAGLSFLATSTALYLGIAACAVALGLVVAMLVGPRTRKARIPGTPARTGGRRTRLTELAERTTTYADQTAAAHGWSGPLNTALERAGINLRPGEFLVLAVSAVVVAFAAGLLLSGVLLGLVLAVATGLVIKLGLSFAGDRRAGKFAEQLSDTLQLLAGSLRAGYGLMQAIDSVSREADDPTADEFRRLLMEVRLGRDLNDALEAMAVRVGNEDFQWVVQAIQIHREIGGDLAEVLETVGGTIRQRDQIRRQVKALSAEGRLSAYVLLALPFGVGFMIYLTNPAYLAELTNGGLLGWGLIATGLLLMTVGAVWLKKITKLVF